MKIIPLSEGTFTIDQTKHFVPFDADNHSLEHRPSGSLLVEIQPFAVVTERDVLLLDTGLGFHRRDETGKPTHTLQLHHNLMQAGISPSDVTKVLLTHLHKDHAGGAGYEAEGLGARLSFPQARYYLQRAELAFAFEKGAPSFIPEELECLRNTAQVELLEGDGIIDGYIQYALSQGHSPWHQVFTIREGAETVFFGGDEAPQLQQMKHRFVAKYDFDGKKAMELRQRWWQQGEEEGWTFLFYHDVKHPVWRFTKGHG